MSLPLIIQHIAVFAAIGVAGYSIAKQRNSKLLYFTCFAIFIAVYALGYLLEITASSLDAAFVACRLEYLGLPFIGPAFYLFCRDYCNSPRRSRGYLLAIVTIPLLALILVVTWPHSLLYFSDVQFVSDGAIARLQTVPGVYFYIALLYSYGLALWGLCLVVRYFVRVSPAQALRQSAKFIVFFLLVAAAQALTLLGVLPGGFSPLSLVLAAAAIALQVHLHHYRTREWTNLGRESVVERMNDAYILMDTKGRFLDANAIAYTYFPQLDSLSAGAPMDRVADFPAELLAGEADVVEFTIGEEGAEGTLYLRASQSPLEYDGRVMGNCILIYDITENHQLLNDLQELASQDALTGLFNRGTFFQYAQRDFDLARRNRDNASVLMLDIDYFKMVNDVHGHLKGDMVLREISSILLSRLRHTDISGRYGGEEIAMWLPGASAEGAAIIADVIRRAVEHTTFESDAGRFHVTVSIGVCALDHARHTTLEHMISDADTALYRAKAEGRNRVCISKPASQ